MRLCFLAITCWGLATGLAWAQPAEENRAATTTPATPSHGEGGGSRLAWRWALHELPEPEPEPTTALPSANPIAPKPPVPQEPRTAQKPSLELADLERIALANNPTLAQATRQIEALRGKQLQAGLWPNPVIGYVGDDIGDSGTAGQQGMFFEQKVVTGGKLRLDRAVAGHDVNQARQAYQSQVQRVLNDVRARFYEVLLAQRTVERARQLVDVGKVGVKMFEDLLRGGEVARTALLQAQIEVETAELELVHAQNLHKAAWRKLGTVLGTPELEPTPLSGNLEEAVPELRYEDVLDRLLAESPELGQARAAVEKAQCALARARAGRVPNMDVEAGVRYDNASGDTVASIGLGMPLPIFDRNQGNIARAQAELSAARHEVERVTLTLTDRLTDTFRTYADARYEVQRYRDDILPKAKKGLDLVRSAYDLGEFDYIKLLTPQRTYSQVNLAYVESLRNLWTSHVQLEGLLLTGGLNVPK